MKLRRGRNVDIVAGDVRFAASGTSADPPLVAFALPTPGDEPAPAAFAAPTPAAPAAAAPPSVEPVAPSPAETDEHRSFRLTKRPKDAAPALETDEHRSFRLTKRPKDPAPAAETDEHRSFRLTKRQKDSAPAAETDEHRSFRLTKRQKDAAPAASAPTVGAPVAPAAAPAPAPARPVSAPPVPAAAPPIPSAAPPLPLTVAPAPAATTTPAEPGAAAAQFSGTPAPILWNDVGQPTAVAPFEPAAAASAPAPTFAPETVESANPAATFTASPVAPAAAAPVTAPVAVVNEVAPGAGSPPPQPPANGAPMRIGDMLVANGTITKEQLDVALTEQIVSGLRLGTQLIALGSITERQLIETLANQLHLPVVDLRQTVPTPEAIAELPEDVARRFEVVPLRKTPAGLELAVADVLNGTRTVLEKAAGGPIVEVLAPPSEIRYAMDQAYLALAGVEQQVKAFESVALSRPRVESQRELVVDANAPIVQVVMMLLTQAVRDRASDIHIEPQDGTVRVRFRIDGVLREATQMPDSMAAALISRIKVMADMNIVERRRSQDGQMAVQIDDRPLDIRVATTATIWGEKAVLRILDKTRGMRNLGELGMSAKTSAEFRELATSPFGMVICTGPTGSGKTTTLYAALNEINGPDRNITTIEDPVEYILPSINQIQVNSQAGITFADGLKSILRQDPDVILVGEIRDVETARIAVQSALTGHLVLSSLHATDSVTALQRFRDMGIEPFLITSSVLAVEAQRLVRRICPHCKEPYIPTPAELTFFRQHCKHEKEQFWHGAGCNLCSHTGYEARVGVYELLQMSEGLKQLVMNDASHSELRDLAIAEGMSTLLDEAVRLIDEDVTTIAEAIRSVSVVG